MALPPMSAQQLAVGVDHIIQSWQVVSQLSNVQRRRPLTCHGCGQLARLDWHRDRLDVASLRVLPLLDRIVAGPHRDICTCQSNHLEQLLISLEICRCSPDSVGQPHFRAWKSKATLVLKQLYICEKDLLPLSFSSKIYLCTAGGTSSVDAHAAQEMT